MVKVSKTLTCHPRSNSHICFSHNINHLSPRSIGMPPPIIHTSLYNLICPNPILPLLDDLPSSFGGLLPTLREQQEPEETLVKHIWRERWVRSAEMGREEG